MSALEADKKRTCPPLEQSIAEKSRRRIPSVIRVIQIYGIYGIYGDYCTGARRDIGGHDDRMP